MIIYEKIMWLNHSNKRSSSIIIWRSIFSHSSSVCLSLYFCRLALSWMRTFLCVTGNIRRTQHTSVFRRFEIPLRHVRVYCFFLIYKCAHGRIVCVCVCVWTVNWNNNIGSAICRTLSTNVNERWWTEYVQFGVDHSVCVSFSRRKQKNK